mmetsp:Transcript_19592/g.46788  ORF Transcript_19592/g.46788 Transcript_19592/m.46788 type:complete len:128 (-) Transcript_19592:580-963(-)
MPSKDDVGVGVFVLGMHDPRTVVMLHGNAGTASTFKSLQMLAKQDVRAYLQKLGFLFRRFSVTCCTALLSKQQRLLVFRAWLQRGENGTFKISTSGLLSGGENELAHAPKGATSAWNRLMQLHSHFD